MPGTGKTSTIAFVARLLAAQGKRVLITSYTHSAIDNIFLKVRPTFINLLACFATLSVSLTMGFHLFVQKLMDKNVDATTAVGRLLPALVRVGKESSCHPDVRRLLVPAIAASLEESIEQNGEKPEDTILPCAESLRKVMKEACIVGVTALTVPRSPLLLYEHFDVVIVDEAGQISQPAVLGALMHADSFILVGDHLQLPPLVQSEIAEKGGKTHIFEILCCIFSISLFQYSHLFDL